MSRTVKAHYPKCRVENQVKWWHGAPALQPLGTGPLPAGFGRLTAGGVLKKNHGTLFTNLNIE